MVRPGGLLMINSSLIQVERPRADVKLVEVPVNDLAREAGSDRAANVAMVGAYCAVKSIVRPETVADVLRDAFSAKGPKVVDLNLRALEFGRRAVDGVAV